MPSPKRRQRIRSSSSSFSSFSSSHQKGRRAAFLARSSRFPESLERTSTLERGLPLSQASAQERGQQRVSQAALLLQIVTPESVHGPLFRYRPCITERPAQGQLWSSDLSRGCRTRSSHKFASIGSSLHLYASPYQHINPAMENCMMAPDLLPR